MEDILIIGAGPAGSAAAIFLGRLGHRVLLADRAKFPRHKVCGECLSPAAVPILERLGLTSLEAHGAQPYYGFKLVSPAQETATLLYPKAHPSLYGYCWSRYHLDNALLQIARSTTNVQVLEECRVEHLGRENGAWSATCVREGNPSFDVRSKAVIQANGTRPLRPQGLPRMPSINRLCLIGNFYGVPDLEPVMECGLANPHLQYLIGPKGKNEAVLCFVLDLPKYNLPKLKKEELMRHWLNEVPGLRERFAGAKMTAPVFGMPLYPYRPASLAEDGLLRVGDATGYMDPITGEGMYRALRTAELASLTLHQAFIEGDLSRKNLRRYEAAAQTEFLWACRFADLCAWAMGKPKLVGRFIRAVRNDLDFNRRIAAIQGALEPARGFFSLGTIRRLAFSA